MAFLTTMRVRSSESGFSRKSKAPSLVARTAASMVPWPEMMMTSGRGFGVHGADLVEGFEAVAVGQPDVEQHDVVDGVAREDEGFGGGAGGGDGVAFFAEDLFERVANLGFVVDDEDVVHGQQVSGSCSGSWSRLDHGQTALVSVAAGCGRRRWFRPAAARS